MQVVIYLSAALLLVVMAFVVFRVLVRRDYRRKGRLTPITSLLELLIWGLYFCFPYVCAPPGAGWFWWGDVPRGTLLGVVGMTLIVAGLALTFGTMLWFGLGRAFGLQVDALVQSGPYRLTRNPQLVGGALLVIGPALLWPSWCTLGWVLLYAIIAHMMVLSEEEHLRDVYGEDYARYCERIPRYLGVPRKLEVDS
jgi:protein-S-isoprenylcysteine O-methyltransferase Ste14